MKLGIQSLQFRRMNKRGRKTMRMVWDVVSRNDSPKRLLIETWGGKPDGYIKCFATDLILGNYLSGRIAKSAKEAKDDDIELSMVGDNEYEVIGPATNLMKAMQATNHENAKMRLKISGANEDWDEDACLNKTLYGIIDFDDDGFSRDKLTQGMASRIKSTFKAGGEYQEHLSSIHEFLNGAGDLSDVLGDEEVDDTEWPPMDRERIAEVIQLADSLREKLVTSEPTLKASTTVAHTPEPEIIRGERWGGWA